MNNGKLDIYKGNEKDIALRYTVVNNGVPIGMVIGVTMAMATMIGFICGYTANKLSKADIEFDADTSKTEK